MPEHDSSFGNVRERESHKTGAPSSVSRQRGGRLSKIARNKLRTAR